MKINAMRRCGQECRLTTIDRLLMVLLLLLLTACGSSQQALPAQAAVDIHQGDACVVCGMYVDAGPGPRAEAWVQGYKAPLKFGSTRDFFAYVTDPENNTRLQQLLVQDSARINWQHPSNEAPTFVDARAAWYVAWQPLHGLMGPTFASFAARHEAEAFVRAHGGEILSFSKVTPPLISLLDYRCPVKGSPAFALVNGCTTVPHSDDSLFATLGEHPDLLRRAHSAPHQINPGPQGNQSALLDGKTR
jgi:copper chaperone NosL